MIRLRLLVSAALLPAALALAQQRLYLGEGGGVDLAALRLSWAAPPARAGMDAAVMGGGL